MTNTITLPRSVVEQALKWAADHGDIVFFAGGFPVLFSMNTWAEALRAALERPQVEQEPVAWMTEDGRIATDTTKQSGMASTSKPSFNIPLYTHPQPPRQPLSDEQVDDGWSLYGGGDAYQAWRLAVEWTERAHGIKEST